jgi:hypothetical protein
MNQSQGVQVPRKSARNPKHDERSIVPIVCARLQPVPCSRECIEDEARLLFRWRFFWAVAAFCVHGPFTATAPSGGTQPETPEAKPSMMKALWQRWKKYGWYGVGTLVTVDVVTLGAVYVALSSGVDIGEFVGCCASTGFR